MREYQDYSIEDAAGTAVPSSPLSAIRGRERRRARQGDGGRGKTRPACGRRARPFVCAIFHFSERLTTAGPGLSPSQSSPAWASPATVRRASRSPSTIPARKGLRFCCSCFPAVFLSLSGLPSTRVRLLADLPSSLACSRCTMAFTRRNPLAKTVSPRRIRNVTQTSAVGSIIGLLATAPALLDRPLSAAARPGRLGNCLLCCPLLS